MKRADIVSYILPQVSAPSGVNVNKRLESLHDSFPVCNA